MLTVGYQRLSVPPLPSLVKRGIRFALRHGPDTVRRAAIRVPQSRFAALANQLFWGRERFVWRGCEVEVNPGEFHGYFAYFFGAYAEQEIAALIELCRDARRF